MKKNMCEEDEVSAISGYSESYIKLSQHRVIFIPEMITQKNSVDIVSLLLYYDNINNEEISIYLHSPGGSADGLISIYDIMQIIKSPIKTICLGKCYSAAAIILAAGTKGLRGAYKNSNIMIHGIQFSFPLINNDINKSKNYLQFVKDNNDLIMNILAHHTGHDLQKIKNDCKNDFYMDAKQAKEYGMIDFII